MSAKSPLGGVGGGGGLDKHVSSMIVEDIDIVNLTGSGRGDKDEEGKADSGNRTMQGVTRPITAISKRMPGMIASPMGMMSSEEGLASREANAGHKGLS